MTYRQFCSLNAELFTYRAVLILCARAVFMTYRQFFSLQAELSTFPSYVNLALFRDIAFFALKHENCLLFYLSHARALLVRCSQSQQFRFHSEELAISHFQGLSGKDPK